jgi:hypothetical protein
MRRTFAACSFAMRHAVNFAARSCRHDAGECDGQGRAHKPLGFATTSDQPNGLKVTKVKAASERKNQPYRQNGCKHARSDNSTFEMKIVVHCLSVARQ